MIDVRMLAALLSHPAGQLGSREVAIRSHLPQYDPTPGKIVQCADCDGETFTIWQIEGDPGVHIQCANCGAVYCCGHDCEQPAHPGPAASVEGGAS